MKKIILASGSPRRKELMELMGFSFEIQPAKGEEVITATEPEKVVEELSYQKAKEVLESRQDDDMLVIGADTIVAYQGEILGKPKDTEDAKRMIGMLQGNHHQVYTGVTVFEKKNGEQKSLTFFEKTDVYVAEMSQEEIAAYVDTKEPMDKAGAYGIQGKFAPFVEKIDGDYYNVVGFPVSRFYRELKKAQMMEDSYGI